MTIDTADTADAFDPFEVVDGHNRLVVIDAETTGIRTPKPDFIAKQPKGWRAPGLVIEIGAVELLRDGDGWRKGATWRTFVNPDGPIRPDSIKIHGIKPGDLKGAPRFPEIVQTLKDFIGDAPILAHAYRNERGFLDYEFARAKLIAWGGEAYPDTRYACTQEMYAQLYPGAPKSMDAMCDRLWLDRSERFQFHGALLDADLTADAFVEMDRQRRLGVQPDAPRSVVIG